MREKTTNESRDLTVENKPLSAHPLATALAMVAYATWPIVGADGVDIGAMSVFDDRARADHP